MEQPRVEQPVLLLTGPSKHKEGCGGKGRREAHPWPAAVHDQGVVFETGRVVVQTGMFPVGGEWGPLGQGETSTPSSSLLAESAWEREDQSPACTPHTPRLPPSLEVSLLPLSGLCRGSAQGGVGISLLGMVMEVSAQVCVRGWWPFPATGPQ